MRKAALITLAFFATTLVMSCSSANTASSSYFGVSDKKAAKKRQKEFQKPKHKIPKCKSTKIRN